MVWLIEFDFWQKPVTRVPQRVDATRQAIRQFFANHGGWESVLAQIPTNKALTDTLKGFYKKIWSNINETSICLSITDTHSSSNIPRQQLVTNPIKMNVLLDYAQIRIPVRMFEHFGFMLSGDLSLKTKTTFTAFVKHYKRKATKIGVFCVPHHGSQNNWDKRLLEAFGHALWVITAGVGNRHRHPDFSVVHDLDFEVPWVWVSDENELRMHHCLGI